MLSIFAKTNHLVAPVETFASKNIIQWGNPIFFFLEQSKVYCRILQGDGLLMP